MKSTTGARDGDRLARDAGVLARAWRAELRPCPGCGAATARPVGAKDAYLIVRCGQCATLYTHDAAECTYGDGYFLDAVPAAPFLARRLDRVVARFDPYRRSGRLLDVGFGGGHLLEAARRAGWRVSGVEVTPAAVEHARRRGIDAFHGTLAEAPFESASFDVVIATEVLEHVVDAAELVGQIGRVLRRGGLLWATTPHGRGLSARILGLSWSVIAPPEHVQLFSIGGMRSLLERAGFRPLRIAAEGINPREILQRARGARTSAAQRVEYAYALNAFLEEGPVRQAVKGSVNHLLSTLRLGDSLKIEAVRMGSLVPCVPSASEPHHEVSRELP